MKSLEKFGFRIDLFYAGWDSGIVGVEISRPKTWGVYWVYRIATLWPPIKRYRTNHSTHT